MGIEYVSIHCTEADQLFCTGMSEVEDSHSLEVHVGL